MAKTEKTTRFPLAQFLDSGACILMTAALGIVCGLLDIAAIHSAAEVVGELFIRLLKLVSTPIIFFSVLSTLTGMANLHDAGVLGGRVIRYTLLTTLIAATIALLLFLLINPTGQIDLSTPLSATKITKPQSGYWQYVIEIVPTSFITPFMEGQVIGVLFLALVLSLAILDLPAQHRERLQSLFEDLFGAIMKLTGGFLKLLPLAVWAFVTTFVESLARESVGSHLLLYFTCILVANIVQATVVLPLLLASKGISPVQTFQGMAPALTVAFFSKSSSAALPAAMDAAQNRLGISPRVARFSFPLCTTINMNACAGFILITVLFVSMLNGMSFTTAELAAWVVVATIAAIGNAGVPMGCFLLATTLLATMNVPLELMGVILPVYAVVDMLESAINVWSDACVTSIVDKETTSQTD